MSNTQIEKLDQTNYDSWKILMRSILIQDDQWGVVSGSTKKTDANAEKFNTTDQKALASILLNVKAPQLIHINNCDTANGAWKKLETT